MTRAGAQRAGARRRRHVARPRASSSKRRVELAPVTPVTGTWMTPVRRDPLEVPLEEKIALLLAANEAALKVKNVRFVSSGLALLREVKTLVTSEGTNVTQTMIRVGPTFSATAIGAAATSRSTSRSWRRAAQGWEYVESLDMPGQRRALGVAGGREADGEERRGRARTI